MQPEASLRSLPRCLSGAPRPERVAPQTHSAGPVGLRPQRVAPKALWRGPAAPEAAWVPKARPRPCAPYLCLVTDPLGHECGLAVVRLLKPLDYYHTTYGSALWGLEKLYLLMSKQHNRGQDGAGIAAIKINPELGQPYLAHERMLEPSPPWQALFKKVYGRLVELKQREPDLLSHPDRLKRKFAYAAELYLGHLRYATQGSILVDNLHPVVRLSNWQSRTLVLAGNFNLTNVEQLIQRLVELGQHPIRSTDTVTALERLGHFLDGEVQALFDKYKGEGLENRQITARIQHELDPAAVIRKAARSWDGGYAMAGLIGHGDAFVARDPNGIRPVFYLHTDEVLAVASERPALATAFNVPILTIQELPPGHAIVAKADGRVEVRAFAEPQPKTACSFERIYFSRGSDADIYRERIQLGRLVTPSVLEAIHHDLDRSVFSFIPNTAQAAFWGMLKELEDALNTRKAQAIAAMHAPRSSESAGTAGQGGQLDPERIKEVLSTRVRVEQVIHKDTSQRTFITGDAARNEMAAHVYDITYGSLHPRVDTLVCIDDSIVRGTTLRQSILRMLSRLKPKCIVIVSSAPQIRYPDCYGIDMSQIGRFIAFQAAIELLKAGGLHEVIEQTKARILALKAEGNMEAENCVKAIYAPFTEVQISARIAEMLHSPDLDCDVKIVFQPVENLTKALPDHRGDWYFTGNYPTPGGNRVVNQAFLNYLDGRDERSY